MLGVTDRRARPLAELQKPALSADEGFCPAIPDASQHAAATLSNHSDRGFENQMISRALSIRGQEMGSALPRRTPSSYDHPTSAIVAETSYESALAAILAHSTRALS